MAILQKKKQEDEARDQLLLESKGGTSWSRGSAVGTVKPLITTTTTTTTTTESPSVAISNRRMDGEDDDVGGRKILLGNEDTLASQVTREEDLFFPLFLSNWNAIILGQMWPRIKTVRAET